MDGRIFATFVAFFTEPVAELIRPPRDSRNAKREQKIGQYKSQIRDQKSVERRLLHHRRRPRLISPRPSPSPNRPTLTADATRTRPHDFNVRWMARECSPNLDKKVEYMDGFVQGSSNRRAPGLVNFVPDSDTSDSSEPGARLLEEPCTYRMAIAPAATNRTAPRPMKRSS